jgi:hypothetical protein
VLGDMCCLYFSFCAFVGCMGNIGGPWMLMRRNGRGDWYSFSRIQHMFGGRVEGHGNDVVGTEDVVVKGEWGQPYRWR